MFDAFTDGIIKMGLSFYDANEAESYNMPMSEFIRGRREMLSRIMSKLVGTKRWDDEVKKHEAHIKSVTDAIASKLRSDS